MDLFCLCSVLKQGDLKDGIAHALLKIHLDICFVEQDRTLESAK